MNAKKLNWGNSWREIVKGKSDIPEFEPLSQRESTAIIMGKNGNQKPNQQPSTLESPMVVLKHMKAQVSLLKTLIQ